MQHYERSSCTDAATEVLALIECFHKETSQILEKSFWTLQELCGQIVCPAYSATSASSIDELTQPVSSSQKRLPNGRFLRPTSITIQLELAA